MTLQASGMISLSDIATEFGGSGQLKLSDYYGADNGVPTSGEIKLSDFYGAAANTLITVTEGSGSGISTNNYGYTDGTLVFGPAAFGSRSPTTFNGVTIKSLMLQHLPAGGPTNTWTMLVILDGIRAQNFFTEVQFEGVAETMLSASPFYYGAGAGSPTYGHSHWQWTTTIASATQWNGSGTSTVRLY